MNKDVLVFGDDRIRRVWHNEDWFYSVVDVVGPLGIPTNSGVLGQVLVESVDSRKYWNKLVQRLRDEGNQVVTYCHRLKMEASDGKMRETDCANLKGIFRIIQSIPSKKAEPFKLWLAKVGSERVKEDLCSSNVYKFSNCDNIDMLPGDLYGSPDESFFLEVAYE